VFLLVIAPSNGARLLGESDKPLLSKLIQTRELDILDKDGNRRISIAAEDSPVIAIYDGPQAPRLTLELKDHVPRITLFSAFGNNRAALYLQDGASTFVLRDEQNLVHFGVQVSANGVPSIDAYGFEKTGALSIHGSTTLPPSIEITDENQKVTARLPAN